jgi:lipopolysaccharide/colanic/teichoic acid biosynthesis glycosyltransferase
VDNWTAMPVLQLCNKGGPVQLTGQTHPSVSEHSPAPAVVARRPLVALSRSWYVSVKGAVEFALALGLLILAAPFIGLAALLVKLTSRGPVVYSQVRLGLDGRPYRIFKIRTMIHDCEKLSGPQWSTKGDRRITPVGRLLRKTHLDELPQLWNVLRGDMSLVGPRPERPEFATQLGKAIPGYLDRLQVRPGITGLAQVQLPPDTDLESVRRKLARDLYYVQHVSLWLDFQILCSTVTHVLHIPFWVPRLLLGVPCGATVERACPRLIAEIEGTPAFQAV